MQKLITYSVNLKGWDFRDVFFLCWIIKLYQLYSDRVTHKGWDCKDDLKLIKYVNYNVKLSIFLWVLFFNSPFIEMTTKETGLLLQRILSIRKIKDKFCTVYSVQCTVTEVSSFVDNPVQCTWTVETKNQPSDRYNIWFFVGNPVKLIWTLCISIYLSSSYIYVS